MPCPICSGCAGPYPGAARSGITLKTEDAVIADRRIYVNADRSKVVDEDSPEAAHLLAAEGDDVNDEEARRLGLMGRRRTMAAAPAAIEEAAQSTPAPKAAEKK